MPCSKRKKIHDFIYFSFFYITLVMRNPKGSHLKWWHVVGTHLNIWKIVPKAKPIRKCRNMILNFFVNLMTFFLKKKWWSILFSYFFFRFVQIFKPKKKKIRRLGHVYLNVFNHIVTFWKNCMNFCEWWVP
jgi:hypothetical protein